MFKETKAMLQNIDSFKPKGIIHIGAHMGEELHFYESYLEPKSNVLWIEANPGLYEPLNQKIEDMLGALKSNQVTMFECLSDVVGEEVEFNITNKTASSSMLKLKEHSKYYPEIVETSKIKLVTETYENLVKCGKIKHELYNVLCIDVQGAELKVLKGMGKLIEDFSCVVLEINEEELYEGCALEKEVNSFMYLAGFRKYMTFYTDSKWGEAIYVKTKL